jgi:hypothetical protein
VVKFYNTDNLIMIQTPYRNIGLDELAHVVGKNTMFPFFVVIYISQFIIAEAFICDHNFIVVQECPANQFIAVRPDDFVLGIENVDAKNIRDAHDVLKELLRLSFGPEVTSPLEICLGTIDQ